ncbi:hypothetical protein ADL27_45295 [Streptomyces sp. NRRL F-6602]|nr:hypothetical protein ADL27_45295 [Streptomyces sp. NRRL F-6602]
MQEQPLYVRLAREVEIPLEVPYAIRVAVCLRYVTVRQLPPQFVEEEESGDEQQFADEGRSGSGVRLPCRGP